MRILRAPYEKGRLPVRIFKEEFDVQDKAFAIHGHKPFTFRSDDREISVICNGQTIGTIQQHVRYEEEMRFVELELSILTTSTIPPQVMRRIIGAAEAVGARVERAVEMRRRRERDLEDHIGDVVSPLGTRRAKATVEFPDAKKALQALMWPGVAERLLPEGMRFERGPGQQEARMPSLTLFATDGVITLPVGRLACDGSRNVYVQGPGDRRPAPFVFGESLLSDALDLLREKSASEDFVKDANRLREANAAASVLMRDILRFKLPASFSMPERSLRAWAPYEEHQETTDLGHGFSVNHTPGHMPSYMRFLHGDTVIYDGVHGYMPGADFDFMNEIHPALFAAAVLKTPFLSFTSRLTEEEQDAIKAAHGEPEPLTINDDEEPEVDLHI